MANTERESKTVLTADDRTGGAFASMQRNIAASQASLSGMAGAVSGLHASLAGLFGGAVIGGFAMMIKGAIDNADAFNKMSQKTGIATEELSKLSYAAALSDVSNEALTKGIKGLSQVMVQATNAASHQAEVMRALGVDVGGSMNDAILKAADTFKALPDGATKAALAVELFGKAGMEMIPLLNQGRAGIERMKDEAEKFGLVMTDQTAQAAEHLNDNLKALGMTTGTFGRAIVSEFAPAFAQMTDRIKEAYLEGGRWGLILEAIGQAGRFAVYDEYATQLQKVTREIKSLTKEFENLHARQLAMEQGGFFAGLQKFFGVDGEVSTEINRVTAQLGTLRGERTALTDADKEAQRVAGEWKIYYANEAKLEENRIRQVLGNDDARKKSASDLQKWNERLAKEDVKGWIAYAEAVFAEADKLNLDLAKLSEDHWKAEGKLRDEDLKGWVAYAEAVFKEADESNLALAKINGEYWKEQDKATAHATRQQAAAMDAWGDAFGNFIASFTGGWKSAMDYAKSALKSLAADLLAFFAKRWVLQMVAGGAGTFGATAASAATSALGGMGNSAIGSMMGGAGGSVLGSAANILGGAFGVGGMAGTAGAYGAAIGTTSIAAGSQAAMLASQTAAFGAEGLALTGAASGGITGSITAALSAIPVWGWIAIAAMAAYAAFGGKGGGPKSGGSYQGMFGADGTLTGTNPTPLFGLKPSENVAGGGVQSIVEATIGAYFKMAGKNAQALNFGLGFDTDPQGTAQNRVMGYVTGADGRSIFSERDREIGRDDKLISGELQLTASRALLAALQASDLQAEMAKLFSGVAAATADQASLDALFSTATDLQFVLDQLGVTKVPDLTIDSLRKMQAAGESLGETFMRVAGGFLTAQADLNQAISARNPQFARDLVLSQRNDIAKAFADALGQNFGDELLARMALNPETFKGLNTETMNLLTAFLGLQTNLEGLDSQLGTLGTTIGAAGYSIAQGITLLTDPNYAFLVPRPPDPTGDARAGLRDYLRGSSLSDNSPLNPMAKYAESRSQYERLLGLAQGGDTNAIGGLGSARDAFLQFSRMINASSGQYNTDFFSTFDQVNAVGGNTVARPVTAGDIQTQTTALKDAADKNSAKLDTITLAVAAMTNAIVANAIENTAETKAVLVESAAALNKIASNGGSLVSTGF